MEPTNKNPKIADFLESAFGRTSAIVNDRCVPAPIGCGQPVKEFRDAISAKEYRISGLCQDCQDKIFGVQ